VPYWSVITYSPPEEENANDISRVWSLPRFQRELLAAFHEIFRVMKPDAFCAVLVGDVRQSGRKVPLGFTTLALLLEAGFQFYDQVIKVSSNAISMRRPIVAEKAMAEDRSVTAHEYVVVVRKSVTQKNDIGLKLSLTIEEGKNGSNHPPSMPKVPRRARLPSQSTGLQPESLGHA
jgi:hypothetical protein